MTSYTGNEFGDHDGRGWTAEKPGVQDVVTKGLEFMRAHPEVARITKAMADGALEGSGLDVRDLRSPNGKVNKRQAFKTIRRIANPTGIVLALQMVLERARRARLKMSLEVKAAN